MGFSIQDYAKKINSRVSLLDCVSISVTTVFLLIFLGFLSIQQKNESIPVSYEVGKENFSSLVSATEDPRPFASRLGKTYTFSWCGGANRITIKNKIYFSDEDEAIQSGRTLSKLCQK
jgi:hypothetical protein